MARHSIKIGITNSASAGFDAILAMARRCEEEGFDDLVFADHLMGMYSQPLDPPPAPGSGVPRAPAVYFDVVAAMSALGYATGRIGLQVGVTEVFRRHPAMLAQAFLSLDHITKGRVVLGIGAGEAMNIVPYGIDFSVPAGRLEEALKIIRLLWSTDKPVDFPGRFWKLEKAVLGIRPYGEKPPQIWLAAMGPRMLDLCARYADGWVPVKQSVEEYGEKLATIKRLAQGYGRDLSNMPASMVVFPIFADTHEEAHRLLEQPKTRLYALTAEPQAYKKHGAVHPLGENYHGLHEFVPTFYTREQLLEAISKIPFEVVHDHMFHGTPEEVCEQLEEFADVGLNHAQVINAGARMATGANSFDQVLRMVRYFQRAV